MKKGKHATFKRVGKKPVAPVGEDGKLPVGKKPVAPVGEDGKLPVPDEMPEEAHPQKRTGKANYTIHAVNKAVIEVQLAQQARSQVRR